MVQCFEHGCFGRCRKYSTQKVILHEGLAAGVLNEGYSGSGNAVWKDELANNYDILKELMVRIQSDYENTLPNMRCPYGPRELEPWMP